MKKLFALMLLSAVLLTAAYGLYLLFSLLVSIGPWYAMSGIFILLIAAFYFVFHETKGK